MDELLRRLPDSARAAMEEALAVPTEDWRPAQKLVTAALEAVDWPRAPAPIPDASALSDAQRVLVTMLAAREGTYVPATFSIPMSRWNRRRWLGLSPASALERGVAYEGEQAPLWRLAADRQKDSEAMLRLLESLPLPDRFEAFHDLCCKAYRIGIPSDHELAFALCEAGFGPDAAAWAPRLADELVGRWSGTSGAERGGLSSPSRALRFSAFLPLARAGVPIEERWEILFPIALGPWSPWMHECLRALGPERRDPVLRRQFDNSLGPAQELEWALDLLRSHPSPWLVRKATSHARKHDRRTEGEVLAEIFSVVEDEPELTALVDAHVAKRPPTVVLKVKKVHHPKNEKKVAQRFRALLEAVAPDPAALFGPDAMLAIVELKEAKSKRTYTAIVHHVDTGVVFRRTSTDVVARILQFHVECGDELLGAALKDALAPTLGREPAG